MSRFRTFFQRNAPPALGGVRYYDHLLKDLKQDGIYHAWQTFNQHFIDQTFNTGAREKWTAVPFLNPVDSPCDPGCVIVSKTRTTWDKISRTKPDGYLVGPYFDFLPTDKATDVTPKPLTIVSEESGRYFRRVYQARKSEAAVIITLVVQDERRFRETPTAEDTHLALENFDDTWFDVRACYMVSHVITASTLKVEVTVDGSTWHEGSFSSATPVCFRCYKLTMAKGMDAAVERILPVNNTLPVTLRRRRIYQHFFNAFIPNQIRMSNAVGDSPPVINWRQSRPRMSFRPRHLPRGERPSTNIVLYYKTDEELERLRLLWQTGQLVHGEGAIRAEQERAAGGGVHI